MKRALVLAGGGVAGIAWELGVLRGMDDVDPALLISLRSADVVIGTSAGSAVAAQITTGMPIEDLYSAQLSEHSSELEVELNLEELMARFVRATTGATGPEDIRRRIGALALETPTVSESIRRAAITARLPEESWPPSTLLLTAVDAETGQPTVFTKDSGVDLVDAVAASCAVPGIWPPVTINGHRYIDGGVRSSTNADLAAGCERVLVITPSQENAPQPWGNLENEIVQLSPADVRVVYASAWSMPMKSQRLPSARIRSHHRRAVRRHVRAARSVEPRWMLSAPSGADVACAGPIIRHGDSAAAAERQSGGGLRGAK